MIHYPHFAFPNLYLENGYTNVETEYGSTRKYENEATLEQAIRCLVLKKPSSLNGWDLRFLRRGLELSQAELGVLLGKNAQTVARWEKSNCLLPPYVDLTIRAHFAQRFAPDMTVSNLVSILNGQASALPEKIVFRFDGMQWNHESKKGTSEYPFWFIADQGSHVWVGLGERYRLVLHSAAVSTLPEEMQDPDILPSMEIPQHIKKKFAYPKLH